jgi:hypothetical protein
MTLDETGALRIALHAEDSLTRALLRQDAVNLQNVIARNTQQDVQVDVPRQEESQQQNFYDGRQGNGQQQERNQNQNQNQQTSDQDFLDQLRLGLIPLVSEESI